MGRFRESLADGVSKGKKRKNVENEGNDAQKIEIDINAPEPPSKKALRRAKRAKTASGLQEVKLGHTDHEDTRIGGDTSEAKAASSRSPHGIWIGNLPFFVTKDDLQNFITGDTDNSISSDYITRIHLPQGTPKPGSRFQNKGFAYIDFVSADVVEKALQLSEKLVGGRRVLIKNSKDFQGRPESTSTTSKSAALSSKRIFVGNLEFDVSKEDLEHHFETCGPIGNVHMATFEDTGKCKGYAWVEFEQQSSAEAAMRGWVEISDALSGAEKENMPADGTPTKTMKKRIWVNKMGGRKLRMEFAEDKATRYKKRFGKESHSAGAEKSSFDGGDESAGIEQKLGAEEGEEKIANGNSYSKKLPKVDHSKTVRSGYSASSVQKLTGGIVDGQGTKITFD
jgi:RNA recognition motif. (a.k.a. RRM, RBD, or RNP domain)